MAFPYATPARPVPGAFMSTPAMTKKLQLQASDPVRRRLFIDDSTVSSSAANGTGPSNNFSKTKSSMGYTSTLPPTTAVASSRLADGAAPDSRIGFTSSAPVNLTSNGLVAGSLIPPVEELTPAARAAKQINSVLQADQNFPDLDSYCRQGASSDYNVSYIDTPWAPFQKTHMYPIPEEVFNHYDSSNLQTMMGLFAEINHAWVVIDNAIFLWDYTNSSPELIGFEDQPHSIQAVALVPPKPGIFVATITHILVVATSSEMVLLGVSSETTPAGTKSVSLYQTKMTLPLRGLDVRLITGSASGRIFFGGAADTDIYELYYQQEERWFSNRCGKINHTNPGWASVVTIQTGLFGSKAPEHLIDLAIDDSRNLLYSLSSRSTIRTYHMEAPNKLTKVIEKEKMHCLRDITHMINASSLLNDRISIVSISPISAKEASKLHLMALTSTGCRLFFSATNAASYMASTMNTMTAPQSMQVQFIKFPPARMSRAHTGGIDLDTNSLSTSRMGVRYAPGFFLDFVSKDNRPNEDLLFVAAPESGRIKSTPINTPLKFYEQGSWMEIGGKVEDVGLVSQPFAASNQPVGFGNELAVQFDQPHDEFAVLTNTGIHVIKRRKLVDIFAAAIRASVGDEGLESETKKFIKLYGNVETISAALAVACGQGSGARPGVARAIDQSTEDKARKVFVDFGGHPIMTEADGTPLSTSLAVLSARHDGLSLYLGRLIRSLWKSAIVSVSTSPAGSPIVKSTIAPAKLQKVQASLERLRKFLDANRTFIQGLSGPSDLQRASSKQEELALQAEHQALHALEKLMESISEGISFVQMLFDERVSDIYARLDDGTRAALRDLTYEKLFSDVSGKDVAKVLVKAIVNRNIDNGSNVETVADALRRRCGSFCSPDDAVIFKAQEQLKRASEQPQSSNAARSLLLESLKLFERVAANLSFANLELAVTHYIDMRYYAGAIRLCLAVAREKDRGNTALSWINEGKPATDSRAEAYAERKKCYDLVHRILEQLDVESGREPETVDGRLTLMATKRMEAYDVVNNAPDEVFHFDLYEWYISQGWSDRLLAIDSPHVITFLKSLASTDVTHAELLCRFYTHRSRFYEAAQVQFELAQSDFGLGIKDRIVLLSHAKSNVNVPLAGVDRQEKQYLEHAITEQLEIAHIQDDLLERLRSDSRVPAQRIEESEELLDNKICDLTTLYNEYADQAGYFDLCLLIYHAADYRNSTIILSTWQSLIQQTHQDAIVRMNEGIINAPHPYESVTARIQEIAHRTSCDSFIFPITQLLPELCQYAVTNEQDASIGADPAWPVQLFISIGISHEMITRILEHVFDTQDFGFTGSARPRLIELIVYVVEAWVREARRRGAGNSAGRGVAQLGASVKDLLDRCENEMPPPGHGSNPGGRDINDVRRQLRSTKREVASVLERAATASGGNSVRF
ncbi:hypothetical protein TD95_002356 [Thielaviopsis punctulata]|uniref:Nucleoporin Nup157/170 n=1 Tax=Thielaviopsis punctulata TaxID=72032 RepID=A0A0F4ZCZ0_9PEZI|nr:hypothetical protein TD95_002356 [Thielaviopsis punctulata]